MHAQDSKTPALVVGVVVAGIVALALLVRYNRQGPAPAHDAAVTASTVDDRPIPASPWSGEAAPAGTGSQSGLEYVSDATVGQSASDIATATAAAVASQVVGAAGTQVGDAMHAMHIDGSSLDAMVDSINQITASLPEDDAKAFQKAVRVMMVASLPIAQLRAQKVAVDKVPPEQLIAGAQKILAGRTPLEVLKMAQARINVELAKRVRGDAQAQSLPASEVQLAR
ncbi:DUF6694 family lipoprotein [Rhodanobacter denitrificans]|uniref:DUF6694 family lipoprotein n=1 Tax=Rhodanobacter denitrificans TaxID=666685 RepID=UPI001F24EC0A|nr:DUF6694 family lipoprotein [Rhodanobacter denitrificans]UJJ60399.1 hypothetical protein LRK55_18340 [Rhodanobacter denitrificans]